MTGAREWASCRCRSCWPLADSVKLNRWTLNVEQRLRHGAGVWRPWPTSIDCVQPIRRREPSSALSAPVFLWSQPVRHGQIGAVYLWLEHDGRPAALGTIFAWRLPPQPWEVMHEFHSLALQPLQLDFRGRTVWAPTEPGLQWQPFADETEVATSQQRQSAQIRQLARQFRAHTVTLEKDKWELRLISRPLHEYATGEGESVKCGAVFAMSQGTDPELILVIEARGRERHALALRLLRVHGL